jgi:hypothetical protein
LGAELFDVRRDANGFDIPELESALVAPSKNCFTARAYAMRVLRLRMLAVKNSMNLRLARSPWARIIDGSASNPARTSAGGGTISSVSRIRGFGIGWAPPRFTSIHLAHKAPYDVQSKARKSGRYQNWTAGRVRDRS